MNGRLLAPDQAVVSALDAGFLLGDGLFESLRASGGVPYLLDRHLTRLLSAAAELELVEVPARESLAAQVARTLERAALEHAYVRVTLTRGASATALAPPSGPPTVVIAALPAPPPTREGVVATLIEALPEPPPRAKSTSRQRAVMARRRVERGGAQEGLYVSADRHVLEGVSSNLFVVLGGRLLTPPATECLPGITRGRLLELAVEEGLQAVERSVEVDTLLSAQEAFVTNAVQGLRQVRAIDATTLAGGDRHDGVFARLRHRYEADRAGGSVQSAPTRREDAAKRLRSDSPVAGESLRI